MKFTVQINASPYQYQASDSAYHFICEALKKGHQIYRVFFYHDGIYNAAIRALPPEDERNVVMQWSQLAEEQNIDLVICISAAQRRGLLCDETLLKQGVTDPDCAAGFRVSGLGQLIEGVMESDRFLVFG
jgi:tRNA 2-thiouridine synthesizing protein D